MTEADSLSEGKVRYSSQIAGTALSNVLQIALGLGTGVLAARFLGAEGRGELAAIQLWPLFFALVAMLGIPEALVFFTAKRPEQARSLLTSGMVLGTLSSLFFICIGFVLMPLLLVRQPQAVVDASRWFLLLLFVQIPTGMTLQVRRGKHDILAWNIMRLLPTSMWLVILVAFAGLNRPNPKQLTLTYLLGLLALSGPVLYVFFRRSMGAVRPIPGLWPGLVRFGLPSALSSVPASLNLRLDQMLLAGFFPVQALGTYVVAVSWGNAFHPLVTALGSVLFPRVASRTSSDERSQSLVLGIRVSAALTLVLTAAMFVATPKLFPLIFGKEFGAAVSTALILVGAGAVFSMNVVLQEGARGIGRPSIVFMAEVAGACTTAVALFLLIHLGIRGAALASFLGYTTVGCCLVVAIARATDTRVFTILSPDFLTLYRGLKLLASRARPE